LKKKDLDKQRGDDISRTLEKGLQKSEEDEQLLKIETKYKIDVENLDEEQQRTIEERRKKGTDFIIQLEKAKTLATISELEKVTQAYSNEIDKRYARQETAFQYESELRDRNLAQQQSLAEQGLANQLAFERQQADKLSLAKKDAALKAQKEKEQAQLVEAYFNAYNAELSVEGQTPGNAAGKALADVLVAKGLSKGLVQFLAEGTDNVKGPGTQTSDSIPAMLSVNEAVIPASSNMKYKGVSKSLINDTFNEDYIPRYSFNQKESEKSSIERAANNLVIQTNKEVIELLTEIKNQPIQQVDVDGLGNLIETVYSKGIKTVTTYKGANRI
jgi:hypothetical protein